MGKSDRQAPYLLFMLGFNVFALGLLAVQAMVRLDRETRVVFEYADTAVCVAFFVDFLVTLY